MENYELWIGTILFELTFWLALYLMGREPKNLLGWFSGGALLATSLTVIVNILGHYAPAISLAQQMLRWRQFLFVSSLFFWLLLLIRLVPSEARFRSRLKESRAALLIILTGTILLALGTIGVLFPVGLSVFWGIVYSATLFFVMGTAVGTIIAQERTEAYWPDYLRSLDYAFFMALLFGVQVVLVMRLATDINFVMLTQLYGTIATAVIVQAFASRLSEFVDQIAFFTFPNIRQKRAKLRATSLAAARVDDSLNLLQLPGDEFAKLTRRAISEMGNLPRLAANPLTNLPIITHRLQEQGHALNTLAQANELKRVLQKGIERLKPFVDEPFGTTDEWRHYNALYFPYVIGLRPYRRYVTINDLSPVEKQAMEWLRAEVPPRTLYNWQKAAAKLIAQDLREQSRQLLREQKEIVFSD
ncbi:MAG: hypothetical protein AAF490_29060 [Chloroflexota bacterium]